MATIRNRAECAVWLSVGEKQIEVPPSQYVETEGGARKLEAGSVEIDDATLTKAQAHPVISAFFDAWFSVDTVGKQKKN